MKKDTGARWEITIDGVPRSYRDRKEMAIEGAEYLKSRNPTAEVTVRDYTGKEPPFVIKPQLPQVKRGPAGSMPSRSRANYYEARLVLPKRRSTNPLANSCGLIRAPTRDCSRNGVGPFDLLLRLEKRPTLIEPALTICPCRLTATSEIVVIKASYGLA
jgi:hypothetical protein